MTGIPEGRRFSGAVLNAVSLETQKSLNAFAERILRAAGVLREYHAAVPSHFTAQVADPMAVIRENARLVFTMTWTKAIDVATMPVGTVKQLCTPSSLVTSDSLVEQVAQIEDFASDKTDGILSPQLFHGWTAAVGRARL